MTGHSLVCPTILQQLILHLASHFLSQSVCFSSQLVHWGGRKRKVRLKDSSSICSLSSPLFLLLCVSRFFFCIKLLLLLFLAIQPYSLYLIHPYDTVPLSSVHWGLIGPPLTTHIFVLSPSFQVYKSVRNSSCFLFPVQAYCMSCASAQHSTISERWQTVELTADICSLSVTIYNFTCNFDAGTALISKRHVLAKHCEWVLQLANLSSVVCCL